MTTPPARRPSSAPTRRRILDAATRLFALKGFDRVSMPDIAAASRITAGAIYKHFASKDDLFFEVVRESVETAPLGEPPAGTGGVSALARIVGGYAAPGLKLVRRLAVEMHHASAQHPQIRKLLRAALDRQIGDLSQAIAAEQPTGAGDPQMTASAVMAFIIGLMHMESFAPHLIGDPEWQRTIETAVAAMIRGPNIYALG